MTFNFKNKSANQCAYADYMLAKTIPMFEWEGLPETIPYRELERILQRSGYAFITDHEGKLYAFTGGLGGVQDVYGNPTEIVISNPALNFNKTLKLESDGVLIYSDDLKLGLYHLYERFAFMQTETDINLTLYGYNTRLQRLISASDDKTKESAELAVKRAIDGDISVISENAIFDGIELHSGTSQTTGTAKSLIELSQFYRASLYNEIGLSANTNLKRERLVSAEVEQGEDSIFPLVLSMLKCRLDAVEKINAMFETEIKVDFGSVWKPKHTELVDDVITDETETGDGTEATATETETGEDETQIEQGELTDETEPESGDESGVESDVENIPNLDIEETETQIEETEEVTEETEETEDEKDA